MQSLGEAMRWFQKEIDWGVKPGELKHLTGRIGELYAALIVNGQMAIDVNQNGYDVVSRAGERISVKTTTMLGRSGAVTFNDKTLELVDRIIVLRINYEEMEIEILLDASIAEAKDLMAEVNDGVRRIAYSKITNEVKVYETVKVLKEVKFGSNLLRELETGTIQVLADGKPITPVKPKLREFAKLFDLSVYDSNGNLYNTRQLGSLVMNAASFFHPTELSGLDD